MPPLVASLPLFESGSVGPPAKPALLALDDCSDLVSSPAELFLRGPGHGQLTAGCRLRQPAGRQPVAFLFGFFPASLFLLRWATPGAAGDRAGRGGSAVLHRPGLLYRDDGMDWVCSGSLVSLWSCFGPLRKEANVSTSTSPGTKPRRYVLALKYLTEPGSDTTGYGMMKIGHHTFYSELGVFLSWNDLALKYAIGMFWLWRTSSGPAS